MKLGAIQLALRMVYPPRCIGCGDMVDSDFGLCGPCWRDTPFILGTCCDSCGKALPPAPGDDSGDEVEAIQCDACMCRLLIFQSPDQSLNPEQRIGQILERPLQFYFDMAPADRKKRAIELLEMVNLPADYYRRFPAELSGGEKQRVSIARAFAAEPSVIVFDEIIASLDTVAAKNIMGLLCDLQDKEGTACLFITHDLATVAEYADHVATFYGGRLIQESPKTTAFSAPHHPYSNLLIQSVPLLDVKWLETVGQRKDVLLGLSNNTILHDNGCGFRERCINRSPACEQSVPPVTQSVDGKRIMCFAPAEQD